MPRWPASKPFHVSVGDVFGIYEVTQLRHDDLCVCRCRICGAEITILTKLLQRSNLTYCNNEECKRPGLNKRFRKEYQIWHRIRAMCEDPDSPEFHKAGALGKRFARRWQEFAAFLVDLGPRPSDDHGVYRIDADGDFTPANCRWALKCEQPREGSNVLTYKGEALPLSAWAGRFGISKASLSHRIHRGWSVEDALETPIGDAPEPYMLTLHGKTQSPAAWARELALSASTICARKRSGKSDEEALSPVAVPETQRIIEFRGEALTLAEWASRIGIHPSNLVIRLEKLTLEEALRPKRPPLSDLTGKTVGSLTVIERSVEDRWRCRCSCGRERLARRSSLTRGTATGCHTCQRSSQVTYEQRLDATAAALRSRNALLYADIRRALEGRAFEFEFVLAPFIFDLVLHDKKLLIEFDGPHHNTSRSRSYDADKDQLARRHGFQVIRIPVGASAACLSPSLVTGL
jgi:very-short-patch-repair endonuclease